ncbi:hypothetical protein [Nocardia pseudobrasiliensis]|uniref:Uncharacterized protein n=1 Tax=Nocardia pseudobrasiliensis TaxID=45979 RepID=A0A370I4S6_9NOCA|nr:hypothetical protein [Nocardia pseudobrasiliensis]RDI65709.1 hypothetical protein DFR76_10524 [Nocardia pseudobrasiliensis]
MTLVHIPDNFPDGPGFSELERGHQYSLLLGWLYCARYDTTIVPSGIWASFTSEVTSGVLERAGLIEIRSTPAGIVCHGGGKPKRPHRAVAPHDSARFEAWWSVWPRKQAKRAAQQAFAKALTKIGFDDLMAATHRFADDPNREDRYTPHPATWLNGERWLDAPQPADPRSTNATARVSATVELGRRLAAAQQLPALRGPR